MCLVLLAVLAAALVLYASRHGVETSADSSVYVGTANSVAAGHGLNVPFRYYPLGHVGIGTPPPGASAPPPTPLVVYAPLGPLLLAIGGHPIGTGRVEDALFVALGVLVAGALVLAETDELWLAAAAEIVLSFSLVFLLSDVGTTSAAFFLAVVALAAVLRHLEAPRTALLVVAALAIGLGTVERFASGGLIVWGVLALRHRRRDAITLFVLSSLPVGGWWAYEQVSGRSTGHYLGFHLQPDLHDGVRTIAGWILPSNSPLKLEVVGAAAVVAVVALLAVRTRSRTARLLVGFALVQVVILEIAITLFDAGVTLDPIEFIPIFTALVLAVACALPRTRALTVIAVVVVAASVLAGSVDLVTNPTRQYAQPAWVHSPIMADVRELAARAVVYTNAPDAIYLLDHRATSSIPETVDFSTLKPNPAFEAQLREIKRTLSERQGYVVYVRGLDRSFVPSESALTHLLPLRRVRNTSDGAVYSLR